MLHFFSSLLVSSHMYRGPLLSVCIMVSKILPEHPGRPEEPCVPNVLGGPFWDGPKLPPSLCLSSFQVLESTSEPSLWVSWASSFLNLTPRDPWQQERVIALSLVLRLGKASS